MEFSTGVTIGLIAAALTLWYLYRRKRMSYFSDLGIPGPQPHFILGNVAEIAKKGLAQCQWQWTNTYGDFVGYYIGGQQILLVSDTEFLKTVMIKDFQSFVDRVTVIPGSSVAVRTVNSFLTILKGQRWKEVRALLTPTFSSGKLKQNITPIMLNTIDTFMEEVKDNAEETRMFDIYKLYQKLTMDVIGRTAFGMQTNVQKNSSDKFLQSCRYVFGYKPSQGLAMLAVCFPEFAPLTFALRNAVENLLYYIGYPCAKLLFSLTSQVIEARRKDPSKRRPDLLQLMIGASMSAQSLKDISTEQLTTEREDATETSTEATTTAKSEKRRFMSEEEIVANAAVFLLAGYETSSTALAYITHLLVNHQDIQQKVREEINELYITEGKLDYNSVSNLPYLEKVINESMRLYPPVIAFTGRQCMKDIQYGNMTIPRGTHIQAAVWKLHHDPKHWTDPETFDPERFDPANKSKLNSIAFQPFGAGPRNCIGMRFALMQIKLTLAKLLHSYFLVPCEKTTIGNLDVEYKAVTTSPKDGVYLKVVPVRTAA